MLRLERSYHNVVIVLVAEATICNLYINLEIFSHWRLHVRRGMKNILHYLILLLYPLALHNLFVQFLPLLLLWIFSTTTISFLHFFCIYGFHKCNVCNTMITNMGVKYLHVWKWNKMVGWAVGMRKIWNTELTYKSRKQLKTVIMYPTCKLWNQSRRIIQ